MTGRERFLAIARGELKKDLFLPFDLNYGWFMDETVERWAAEGLPVGANLLDYFGLDRVEFTSGNPYSPIPPFEEQVILEDEETQVIRNEIGVTERRFKRHGDSKMPQWLDFPIKSRSDFREFQKRLDPHSPSRYMPHLEQLKRTARDRDYPLGIGPGSFFGHTLQRWVGTENLCMLFYDDPSFLEEMLEYLEYFFLEVLKRFLHEVKFDFASFGEDIAYKEKCFISPRMFRQFIQPRYIRICELLRRSGIEVIFVDSDGYIGELIPLWLQVGINGFSPLEVASGVDAISLKIKYGKDIILAGNVDKRALARGKREIDREVEKVRKLLGEGGYFPAVDHSVPPDVPMGNFTYFLESLRKLQ